MSHSIYRPALFAACSIALLSVCGTSFGETPDQVTISQRFADPAVGDAEAFAAGAQLRKLKPLPEEAPMLAAVANSPKLSNSRKRIAVALLFERHVHAGMTIDEVSTVLAKAKWLSGKDLKELIGETGGGYPIEWVNHETRFGIAGFLWEGGLAIYLRIGDESITEKELLAALHGETTSTGKLKVTAIGFPRFDYFDLLMHHREKVDK
jgi:hypothetical protein